MSNVAEMKVEKTPTAELIIPIVEDVQKNRKEQKRTLAWNVRAMDDRKQKLDLGFEYGRTKKKQ
ncbi:hypothetical protein DVH24_008294 [Malus domestica]|uniref:Uncharacterized protein n=1 Tax=Malus domestica TaxID=3750 RepID=A0A498JPK6_MALDO|nr:hypothetical protein DVH24_008294 [Malus domestica]